MGLLSLAIWTPIAFGVLLLAIGRDEHARAVRETMGVYLTQRDLQSLKQAGRK